MTPNDWEEMDDERGISEEEAEKLAAKMFGGSGERKPVLEERGGFRDEKYFRLWLPRSVFTRVKILAMLKRRRPAEVLDELLPHVQLVDPGQ